MFTNVMAMDGSRLMPTSNIKKVRKLLKSGRAKIFGHNPFTIQLLYETEHNLQPVELSEDTGYENIGLSVKSEKHEYTSRELKTLTDEKQHHDSCKKYRRTRRNRKRYRKPRFDNRKATKPKGWIPPSLEHKVDLHVREVKRYMKICPVTRINLEVGQFDTQVLAAVEKGEPVPKSVDYQHGPRYGYDTQREAVFARDGYCCRICGRSSIKDGVILRVHHIYYWKHDRSNRLWNLAAVCTDCHCPANHQPGGALYKWDPELPGLQGAAFMNTVKWYIYEQVKAAATEINPNCEVKITYGAVTKRERLNRHIEKSHANDAYCIGMFHPKHRSRPRYFEKVR
ncbi:MAG: RNA-guided endonuclease IscB [Clostridiales bacterium]|nr:RNA-guided endonuclease IscB [Clostridiales bacterium]